MIGYSYINDCGRPHAHECAHTSITARTGAANTGTLPGQCDAPQRPVCSDGPHINIALRRVLSPLVPDARCIGARSWSRRDDGPFACLAPHVLQLGLRHCVGVTSRAPHTVTRACCTTDGGPEGGAWHRIRLQATRTATSQPHNKTCKLIATKLVS